MRLLNRTGRGYWGWVLLGEMEVYGVYLDLSEGRRLGASRAVWVDMLAVATAALDSL